MSYFYCLHGMKPDIAAYTAHLDRMKIQGRQEVENIIQEIQECLYFVIRISVLQFGLLSVFFEGIRCINDSMNHS